LIVADGWRSGIRVGPDLGHKSTSWGEIRACYEL
jgi:hypothetical protein